MSAAPPREAGPPHAQAVLQRGREILGVLEQRRPPSPRHHHVGVDPRRVLDLADELEIAVLVPADAEPHGDGAEALVAQDAAELLLHRGPELRVMAMDRVLHDLDAARLVAPEPGWWSRG